MAQESSDSSPKQKGTEISPELVRAVAKEVYAMWLKDLKIEHDRLGGKHRPRQYRQRGL